MEYPKERQAGEGRAYLMMGKIIFSFCAKRRGGFHLYEALFLGWNKHASAGLDYGTGAI